MNENQIKKEEIEYRSAKVGKRALALLVDAFLTVFTAVIFFATSNALISSTPFYLEEKTSRENLQKESGLYTDDFILISEYVDSSSLSTREKNEYLSKHINDFYSNSTFIVDADPYKEYDQKMMNGEEVQMPRVITGYELVADDQVVEPIDGGWGVDNKTGQYHVELRYDLPESAEFLSLRPIYSDGEAGTEDEEIWLN